MGSGHFVSLYPFAAATFMHELSLHLPVLVEVFCNQTVLQGKRTECARKYCMVNVILTICNEQSLSC
jgi:hypothetical protein